MNAQWQDFRDNVIDTSEALFRRRPRGPNLFELRHIRFKHECPIGCSRRQGDR